MILHLRKPIRFCLFVFPHTCSKLHFTVRTSHTSIFSWKCEWNGWTVESWKFSDVLQNWSGLGFPSCGSHSQLITNGNVHGSWFSHLFPLSLILLHIPHWWYNVTTLRWQSQNIVRYAKAFEQMLELG